MLHLADARPALRQILASGRVAERITGRGLAVASASLTAQPDAARPVPLPARLAVRSAGFFAFSLLPDRDMPDFSAAVNVTLRAELILGAPAAAPLLAERRVAGSVLALAEVQRIVAGREVTLRIVAGAPIDLSVTIDPAPVALRGIVLHGNDPARPAAGVRVAAGPAVHAETDAEGRFFLPTLPLQAEVVLELTHGGGDPVSRPFRIDFTRPVNSATLSLPG